MDDADAGTMALQATIRRAPTAAHPARCPRYKIFEGQAEVGAPCSRSWPPSWVSRAPFSSPS
jgi:hypothetical protein